MVRESIKDSFNIPWYKLVIQVIINENGPHGMKITSKCLWDPNTDNFAQYVYKNDQFNCTVIVFGLYNE